MGDFTKGTVAVPAKIYYVLKRDGGSQYLADDNFRSFTRSLIGNTNHYEKGVMKFITVQAALAALFAYAQNQDRSKITQIVRVEETAGTPVRRLATCSETPTGYAIKDGPNYSSNPDGGFGEGWVQSLDRATLFTSEASAINALTRRSMRLGLSYSCTIARIIDVPATPVFTETVLA